MLPVLRLLRAAEGSDRDLLDRYVRDRDEPAFETLVRRYGGGVWAACVRLAGRDAEDAFQAVFFTLSRKAGTVSGSLPAWLHAVTRRVAANLRRKVRRQDELESAAAAISEHRHPEDVGLREALTWLDEELARMPERYRAVLIVCCLENRSRDEAAAQLGWTEGQVKGRLERAREMLRTRLARRGVELGGVLLAATAACGPAPARSTPSPEILSLARGVMRDMAIQKQRLVAAALAIIVAGAGFLLARTPEDKDKPRSTERTEKAEEPAKGWEFVGHMQATAAVEIRSLVTGSLVKIPVKEGDAVKKGDLLAEIDSRTQRLQVAAAQAKLRGAEARFQLAKIESDNVKRLQKNNAVSADEVALHVAKEAEAEAAVLAAKVEVERAELTMSWTRITAPMAGRVSRIQISEGGLVTAEQTHILTIVSTDRLYMTFNVSENLLLQLRRDGLADAAALKVAYGLSGETGHPNTAVMDSIDQEVDPRTGSMRFRAILENPKGLLSPGMTVRVRLTPSK